MTKTISLRMDDRVAALVAERAARRGVSINQEINDSILRSAEADITDAMESVEENIERYSTVMELLA